MDSKGYLALNAWLQKSDQNYIAGRFLFKNMLIHGSANLLWLALEQVAKILLLQKKIEEYSGRSTNLEDLYKILDDEGKKLNAGHSAEKLIRDIAAAYPDLDIYKYESSLQKVNEYFRRRYVVHGGSVFSLALLNDIDDLYFLLRDEVDPEIGIGTIDEIYAQRKNNLGHPLPAFEYAYFENKHFRTRRRKKN